MLDLKELARVQGFEPQHSEPESDVLPLDDTRTLIPLIIYLSFNKFPCQECSPSLNNKDLG